MKYYIERGFVPFGGDVIFFLPGSIGMPLWMFCSSFAFLRE
jgi:hypothetical protein